MGECMEIEIPKWLEKSINMLIVQKGKKYLQECIESMIYKEKQLFFEELKKEYIRNKLTGKEFFTLTGSLPSKEMHIQRRDVLKYTADAYQERFYLKVLAENGDNFGYADEYFSEIIQKVEFENNC
jgi:hypothetical protein